MLRSLRAGNAVLSFGICLAAVLGPGAIVAAGDDGPSRPPRADRPTRTVLRPTEVPELAPFRVPVQSGKEAIILVSGLNTAAPDGTFDRLIATLFGDPRYAIYRFGADPEHPFDANGDIDVNAVHLRDEIRAIGATHPAVHIVAHSMGGVVADRAFSAGLSASDGVATYIALASPHSGSAALATASSFLDAIGQDSLQVRAAFSPKIDPGSPVARGLATAGPVPPPAGVIRLDLRAPTDFTVTANDAKDPGVASRILWPSDPWGYIDGHGAVTRDPEALRLIRSTIEHRAVPPDDHSRTLEMETAIADAGSSSLALLMTLAGLLVGCCLVGLLMTNPPLQLITRPLAAMQLRAVRRP
ncbi:MAG: hypothetical protein ABI888_03960 [Chloroflexota bacterium]